MLIEKQLITPEAFEQFTHLPENMPRRFELIHGAIIEVPSNAYSSSISILIAHFMMSFVHPRNLGHVTGESGGYMIGKDRVAPDVAYISKARQPKLAREGYNPNPPELVVEVISPTDKPDDIADKLALYERAGIVVWTVYPDLRQIHVYNPGQAVKILEIEDTLDGGDILPGFTLTVKNVFPDDDSQE